MPIQPYYRFINYLRQAGFDWFLPALVGMIVLAYFWPEPGVQTGFFSLKELAGFGVSVIFFFYGLRLNPEKLKTGLRNWKLHATVQLTTFLLFPALILSTRYFIEDASANLLWLGTFYLAALPSTVSSSVVMVSIAGGNIAAAIFNASISSLLGILVTPLWMGIFLSESSAGFDFSQVILKLALQVLLPVILGFVLHYKWGKFAESHKGKLRIFDQSIILLIVYTSFCESFARNMFASYSISNLVLLALGMAGLFFLVMGFSSLLSKLLGFNREDSITLLFCGSKKSLVHGTVMSKVLFPDANVVGIILLPIMLYHALQLFISGIIAQQKARKLSLH